MTKHKTVVVTGCMGFIGSNLVARLLKNRMRVIGFDNLSNPSLNPTDRIKKEVGEKHWPAFSFYNIDVTDHKTLTTICANARADAVIHLAAAGSVPRSFADPMTTVKNNELGFASVMLTASKLGIEQFIYASSSSVYGDNADLVKTEGNEGKPLSPYALSKKMNEEFARVWGQNLRTIGLRFFNVYGPGQRPDSSYAAVIPRFLCWDEVEIYGDGTQVRDFTYVDDVCEAIIKSLEYKGPSIVLNVGAGEMTTVNQLAELCRTAAQPKPQLTLSRPGDISFSVADTTLLEKTLGFKPQTKIAEGIIRTRHFYDSMRLEHGKEQQPDR